MNKVTKTAIVGLLALFAGNAAATDGEIVFDGEILKSACEINDSDKKIEVALGHYNAEQFRSVGERSPKIPFTIPLVNCPVTGWSTITATLKRLSVYGWKRGRMAPSLTSLIWQKWALLLAQRQQVWVSVLTMRKAETLCH